MITATRALALSVTLAAAFGCDRNATSSQPTAAAADRDAPAGGVVVARVNGVALYEEDVQLAVAARRSAPPPSREQVIEALVDAELMAQRARELELDADPDYRRLDRVVAARAAAERRKALAELYSADVAARAVPTDAEARAYFDDNRAAIQSQLHVWQILVRRDRAAADQMLADIRAGAAFEDVAARQFDVIPPGRAPWDLGFLAWKQIPAAWRPSVFDLATGAVSDVIEGPGERYWIVKVVERRTDSKMTFDAALPAIRDVVRAERLEAARAAADEDLRAGADVDIVGQ